jgi:hypothetical protein
MEASSNHAIPEYLKTKSPSLLFLGPPQPNGTDALEIAETSVCFECYMKHNIAGLRESINTSIGTVDAGLRSFQVAAN